MISPAERREAAEQRGVRQRPAEVLERDARSPAPSGAVRAAGAGANSARPELVEAPRAVDEHVAVVARPWNTSTWCSSVGSWTISASGARIGSRRRISFVDAAERDHRRARALRAEARKRLRMPALEEGGDREQLGRRDDALAAAPVDADLEQPAIPRLNRGLSISFGKPSAGRTTTH